MKRGPWDMIISPLNKNDVVAFLLENIFNIVDSVSDMLD